MYLIHRNINAATPNVVNPNVLKSNRLSIEHTYIRVISVVVYNNMPFNTSFIVDFISLLILQGQILLFPPH